MTLREKILLPLEMKKLERTANKLTKKIGVQAKIGTDFQAILTENTILFALVETVLDAQLFYQNILQNFPEIENYDFEPFVFSFLHEMGHCVTRVKEGVFDLDLRNRLKDMDDREKANKLYFALPAERAATNWAIAYAIIYSDEVIAWQKQMLKAYKRFFDKFQIPY